MNTKQFIFYIGLIIKLKKMKYTILKFLIFTELLATAQISEAGKWLGNNDLKDNPYELASDEYMKLTLESVAAYNNNDVEKELSFYEKEFADNAREYMQKYHGELKSVNMQPWAMIPVKVKGSDNVDMLVWSTEKREWKNGSTQKVYLMEVFTFNKDKKINNFNQWRRFDPKNEFGLPYGGKFYGKKENEYSGRSLVFSNRGEVKKIESLIENYNKMDGEACQAFFAENAVFDAYDGERYTMSAEFFKSYFENYESVIWKAYGIIPLKIQNTDPASGVLVSATEKRVSKDGSVWDKELMEQFYFNLDGKIEYVEQWVRDKKK